MVVFEKGETGWRLLFKGLCKAIYFGFVRRMHMKRHMKIVFQGAFKHPDAVFDTGDHSVRIYSDDDLPPYHHF